MLKADAKIVFIAGHHRSGTSVLHRILRSHPKIVGFHGTGAHEDEGQHLQSVFPPASYFGGPGKYIFNPESYMDERHALATKSSAEELCRQWGKHLQRQGEIFIEKSPPTLIRTRFFQALFPRAKFIIILRHPFAVAAATQKWSKTSLRSLINHTLLGYERLAEDLHYLDHAYVLRYEDFVDTPEACISRLHDFIGVEGHAWAEEIRSGVNDKYFNSLEGGWKPRIRKAFAISMSDFEGRANKFGYSLKEPRQYFDADILGDSLAKLATRRFYPDFTDASKKSLEKC
jgi:hypothetical protein